MSYLKSVLSKAKYYMTNGKADKAAELLDGMNENAVVNEIINRSIRVEKPTLLKLSGNTFTGKDLEMRPYYDKESLVKGLLEVVVGKGVQLQREVAMRDANGAVMMKDGKELKMKVVAKLPEFIHFKGIDYMVVGADNERIYFWPVNEPIPQKLQYWFDSKNEADVARFSVPLKAKGCYRNIEEAGLYSAPEKDGFDLGAIIVKKEQMNTINSIYGFDCEFSQVRILFNNGKYAKGQLASDEVTGMEPGYYGSMKGSSIRGEAIAVDMVILASFYRQLWSGTANDQQFTYAGIEFPMRYGNSARIMKEYSKVKLGEPAVIDNLRQYLVNDASRALTKIDLDPRVTYASQVAIRDINSDANLFVCTDHADWHGRRENMTLLFSPYLPVHTNFYRVNVQFIFKPEWSGMIGLNVNQANAEFIVKYWNQFFGRDCDGDGVILTTDSIVHIHSIHYTEAQWINTLQWKGIRPADSRNRYEAIQRAFEKIITQHALVGVFDLMCRRILQNKKMTWDERTRFARAIQGAITSVKDIVELKDLVDLNWIFKIAGNPEFVKKNSVDAKKDIQMQIKRLNQAIDAIKFSKEENDLPALKKELEAAYEEVKYSHYFLQGDTHYTPFKEVVERAMALTYDKSQTGRIARLGEKVLFGMDETILAQCAGMIQEIKNVWKDNMLEFQDKMSIVSDIVDEYKEKVGVLPVLGAIMTKLSAKTAVAILGFDDVEKLDKALGNEFYADYLIPVKHMPKFSILSKNQICTLVADPNILSSLEDAEYKVISSKEVRYYNWMQNTGNCNQSQFIIKLRMVKA